MKPRLIHTLNIYPNTYNPMKNHYSSFNPLTATACLVLMLCACWSCSSEFEADSWQFRYCKEKQGVNIYRDGEPLAEGVYASFKLNGEPVDTRAYSRRTFTKTAADSVAPHHYTVTYIDKKLPTLKHHFYVYPDDLHVTVYCEVESHKELETNYMAAICMDDAAGLLPASAHNRALFIPFDNDKWVRYASHPLTFDQLTSYEATAIFNNQTRNALVVGSVQHDVWKTAVQMKAEGNTLKSLICYAGVADELTRDRKPHGSLKGKNLKSPKLMLGRFDDWRRGLETYGIVNAAMAPPPEWNKAVPFGWNSWGALQFNLNYEKAIQVSNFMKENLQHNFFSTDSTLYIGLDSGWDSFSEEQLKAFANHCKANGQVPGIYWTPFTDWWRNADATIAAAPQYTYKDIYLYANGETQELDGALAIDPTHPAVEAMMKDRADLFRRTGFEYVKLDFMTHGALEADAWHRPEISTGMQAYNYGMKLISQHFEGMYINLSISPLFPSNYAHSRRMACDAWNKIKDTEYTLNALSYGWWQKFCYRFNDPDHIVLRDATEGENRARVTSGVISGLCIVGDDFSDEGPAQSKERALKFLTNGWVNYVANGQPFRPVEGDGRQSEDIFLREDGRSLKFCAAFNYSDTVRTVRIPYERIGLETTNTYDVEELWTDESPKCKDGVITFTIPPKDARLIRLIKNLNRAKIIPVSRLR